MRRVCVWLLLAGCPRRAPVVEAASAREDVVAPAPVEPPGAPQPEPSTSAGEGLRRVVIEGCGQYECCVVGDRLSSDTELYETLEAEVPSVSVPGGSRVARIDFLWVFEDLVEVDVIAEQALCRAYAEGAVDTIDPGDLKKAYLLDFVEENGVSLWMEGRWTQTSADCLPQQGPVSPSTTWARLTIEGGAVGLLPLDLLSVEAPEEEGGEEPAPCSFGERRTY